MKRTNTVLFALAALAAAAPFAHAYTLEYRIVERVSDTDFVLPSSTITVGPRSSHRYRIQFRVVPDGPNDAIAGFVGYNVGTIVTTGGINTRSAAPPDPFPHGRLAPFTFAPGVASDGLPRIDPFTSIDSIDAVVPFVEAVTWNCGADGQPLPRPVGHPVGRGEWISVFEITSVTADTDYAITFGGNAIVGTSWAYISCPPPVCGDPADPADDEPSDCQIAFRTDSRLAFSVTLNINVCPGEWNNDRQLNTQDVFDFFTAFFAGSADVNNDGATNTQDYFDFIIAFLLGCR